MAYILTVHGLYPDCAWPISWLCMAYILDRWKDWDRTPPSMLHGLAVGTGHESRRTGPAAGTETETERTDARRETACSGHGYGHESRRTGHASAHGLAAGTALWAPVSGEARGRSKDWD
jgi:hypothetical protein